MTPRRCLGTEQHTLEIDAEDAVEILLPDVQDAGAETDPGVVDHDVEPAVRVDGATHQSVDVLATRHVRGHGGGAQRLCLFGDLRPLDVPHDDQGAFTRKPAGAGEPDSLGGPRSPPQPCLHASSRLPRHVRE